ncbi:SMC-Scp complex subunit ScpB [Oleiagrimonas sp. C23AA]|uniref:SMC-Scp complex subunit ScpB n=1 Tax=Oleiagrimonas sp. C23AA TaxID=2719047 RepID=UPI00141F86BC|nr:SMC-Scp complex subunit ScpB [Oleiagrimonas sp. C23AA]NII11143.1 SMC-Scp complex subunit ScpB [Oleiagrimonas sp. C23AA]
MEHAQLKNILEAALLASSHPMNAKQLADLFSEEEAITREDIGKALELLADDCEQRGVELVEVASGFRLQIRQNVYPWVARMWAERPSRYSRALLETLALIAYRQPITRGEIEAIRGVVVSSSIIKTLEERDWIRVVGHRDVPGKPALLGTTREFLDYFNLKSLDQLPTLAEVRDMEEINPQLDLDRPRAAQAALPSGNSANKADEQSNDDGADISPDAQALAAHAERAGQAVNDEDTPSDSSPLREGAGNSAAADAPHEPRATVDEAEDHAEDDPSAGKNI